MIAVPACIEKILTFGKKYVEFIQLKSTYSLETNDDILMSEFSEFYVNSCKYFYSFDKNWKNVLILCIFKDTIRHFIL